jgi:putative nucleotidyltransferase with HDIG domain
VSERELRLSEVVAALSHALDLTEGEPRGHAVRTCLIGMRIAEEIGLDSDRRSALFYALLLKDTGCSSNASRVDTLFRTEDHAAKHGLKRVDFQRLPETAAYILRTAGRGHGRGAFVRSLASFVRGGGAAAGRQLVAIRCQRGAEIARMLGFHEETALAIRTLDEHWNGHGYPDGLRGERIPMLGRIACLAQTVEVFVADRGLEGALAMVRERRGRWFDPALVDAFEAVALDRPFWAGLTKEDVSSREPSDRVLTVDEQLLDRIAEAFAQVIDAKSPYTHRHSERVAEIAVAIAEQIGLNAQTRRLLRRAGLLHDIGKLAVPNTILDKRGSLTEDERFVVEDHPGHSQAILGRVAAFGDLAVLAGAHHERIDGSGYPNARRLTDLTLEMRILAVADVFEAMTARRPYRDAMTTEEALDLIGRDAGIRLCAVSVSALEVWADQDDGRITATA